MIFMKIFTHRKESLGSAELLERCIKEPPTLNYYHNILMIIIICLEGDHHRQRIT